MSAPNSRRVEKMANCRFVNKTIMRKVNRALVSRGWPKYEFDRYGNPQETGYVINISEALAGADQSGQREVEKIINDILDEHYRD